MFSTLLSTFLYVFTTQVTVVNPLGGAFFFLSLTKQATRGIRCQLANRVALYFFVMAIVILWAGAFVLSFFGISLGVLRVAGGLVLFSAGWLSLNSSSSSSEEESTGHVPGKTKSVQDWIQMAFYPFTLPLTLGPGCIAVTIAIGTSMPFTFATIVGAVLGVLANAVLIWLCLRYADRITDFLGQSGSDAISRIFSFILLCIGVQIFWTGFSELWLSLMQAAPK